MSSRGFDKNRISSNGELPEYGAIFMSNKPTKKECLQRKLLGLPMAFAPFVTQVKAGMILFLFEFESRQLHGVFRAVSDGAINIVAHAYSSSGKQFPAQIKFEQVWHCNPLQEHEFRDAIRENYFSRFKFNFGLSNRQVRSLLVLFSSRKIKDDSLQMNSPLSEVPRGIEYAIDKPRHEDTDDFAKLPRDGRLGTITSRYSADYPHDFTYRTRGLIDNSSSPSAALGNTHGVDNEVGSLILAKQIGDFFGEIKRSLDDRALISEAAGNEHNMDLETQRVFATDTRGADHSHFATGYGTRNAYKDSTGTRNAYEDGTSATSYVPNLPSLYVPYVPHHKGACPTSDLLNSVLRPSFSSSEDLYPERTSILPSLPTCPEIEARKKLRSENPRDAVLTGIPIYDGGVSQAANEGNEGLSSSEKDHSVLLDNNDLNPSFYQNADMYADRKYRVSVFDRLALPSKTSKSNDATCARNNDCYLDFSVDEIMDALQQDRCRSMETGSYGPLNSSKKKETKRKILNSKLCDDPAAEPSREMNVAVNYVIDDETSQLPEAESIPFVNFKRRSKVQNTPSNAVNVDSGNLSQHKRRKLVRPKFHKNESLSDYVVGRSDNGGKPPVKAESPLAVFHDSLQFKKNVAGEIPDYVKDDLKHCGSTEAVDDCNLSSSKKDEDRKELSLHVRSQGVFSPLPCKVEDANVEYLSLESIEAQNLESLRSAKVEEGKYTSDQSSVLDVLSSASRKPKDEDADENLSLGIIPNVQNYGSIRNSDDGKEESDKTDVPNCIRDPVGDKLANLESSEAGKLVQLRDYACHAILQDLTSSLNRGERSESGLEIVVARNHVVDDTEQLP